VQIQTCNFFEIENFPSFCNTNRFLRANMAASSASSSSSVPGLEPAAERSMDVDVGPPQPRDALIISDLLKSSGVQKFDPKVVAQLLEFSHREFVISRLFKGARRAYAWSVARRARHKRAFGEGVNRCALALARFLNWSYRH